MHTILNNLSPRPFTLGVPSTAALGAVVASVLGVSLQFPSSEWFIFANAFFFAAVREKGSCRLWGRRCESARWPLWLAEAGANLT